MFPWFGSSKESVSIVTSRSAWNQPIGDESATTSPSNIQLRTADIFSLESIRSTLIRQEETIIFALIERAQYYQNLAIYDNPTLPGHSFRDQDGVDISFFDWMLMETEKLHSQVRRYTSPEEHPFHPSAIIRPSKLPTLNYPVTINNDIKEKVNVNTVIKSAYIKSIIPRLWYVLVFVIL